MYSDGIPREMGGDGLVSRKGRSKARDVLGMSTKRGIVLLAVMAAVMFLASGLSPGEPDAQTAAPNGKIVYSGFDPETNRTHIYTMNPDGTGRRRASAAHCRC
jgi:hypothetical protein